MMERKDRAKQFLPFDAMKGLSEALREREEKVLRVERREPDEEESAALNDALIALKKGDRAEIVFFRDGGYFCLEATVSAVDAVGRKLVVGGEKIPFFDLFSIKIK